MVFQTSGTVFTFVRVWKETLVPSAVEGKGFLNILQNTSKVKFLKRFNQICAHLCTMYTVVEPLPISNY